MRSEDGDGEGVIGDGEECRRLVGTLAARLTVATKTVRDLRKERDGWRAAALARGAEASLADQDQDADGKSAAAAATRTATTRVGRAATAAGAAATTTPTATNSTGYSGQHSAMVFKTLAGQLSAERLARGAAIKLVERGRVEGTEREEALRERIAMLEERERERGKAAGTYK